MLNNKSGTIEIQPGTTPSITRSKSGHLLVVRGGGRELEGP